MNSLILSTSARFLLPLLILFSIFLLLRGHYEPGGGFVGGLVASSAFALYSISEGVVRSKKLLYFDSHKYIYFGLTLAASSAVIPVVLRKPFMTGLWIDHVFPVIGRIGTPLLFDVGVYFVVIGVALTIIFNLFEEH